MERAMKRASVIALRAAAAFERPADFFVVAFAAFLAGIFSPKLVLRPLILSLEARLDASQYRTVTVRERTHDYANIPQDG